MKDLVLRLDARISISQLARAMATLGCTISTDENGELRVSKRRVRKPAPGLAVVEAKQPKAK